MVKGLDKFREYFADFSEQYVQIGGAGCDRSFKEGGADFRATKDLNCHGQTAGIEQLNFQCTLKLKCTCGKI